MSQKMNRRVSRPVRAINGLHVFLTLSCMLFGLLSLAGVCVVANDLFLGREVSSLGSFFSLTGAMGCLVGLFAKSLLTRESISGLLITVALVPAVLATVAGLFLFAAVLEHFLNPELYIFFFRRLRHKKPHGFVHSAPVGFKPY